MKIVVLDGYTLNPGDLSWQDLEKIATCEIYDRTPPSEVINRIGDADIVITNKTPLTDEIFDACPSIRYIGVLATGYNVVDVEAAKKRNIAVTNIPMYGTDSVAQFTFALLLEVCHHVAAHDKAVKQGRWKESGDFCFWDYPLIELSGKKMGIIGFGRIGQAVAKIANAFGMEVLAYNRSGNKSVESEQIKFVGLDELFTQSDVISLHCPLFPETEGMINADTLKKMKKSAILLNTSRGALIVEQDLADALNNDEISGAAVDVVSVEPISEENPLLHAKNCIITPHIAWAPIEARSRLLNIAIDNLEAFLNGKHVNRIC
ncbi:D-2-hydroxyacid dehydrogenase [Bacillus sp. B15-48]|uniref:D-2-hydroxyacid dehydrogenase n=1 Tax=Bacillus sp. B15-48 TaxID=1548601 RepID=UPI00193FA94F|nr:D-2-hydroxyacid dehydrogenase [Bacillus sp. B15-48]MBM4761332.1 D-2-hydroxyacid dehydrogenase [Bacillus sp. B15-48]